MGTVIMSVEGNMSACMRDTGPSERAIYFLRSHQHARRFTACDAGTVSRWWIWRSSAPINAAQSVGILGLGTLVICAACSCW